MASYEIYLATLEHDESNVATEKLPPLKNEKKSLLVKIEAKKRENAKLSEEIGNLQPILARLRNELGKS